MANIAVLAPSAIDEEFMQADGYGVLTYRGEVDWLPIKFNAEQLFHIMTRYDIEQIWVVPGAAPVRLLPLGPDATSGSIAIMFEHEQDAQGKSFIHDDMGGWKFNKYGDDHLSSCFGYREGGTPAERKMRGIIWPEFSGWQLEPGSISGPAMLAALNRLQGGLGVNLSSSPGVTGRNLVVEILKNQNHSHWLSGISIDLDDLPLKQGVADLAWKANLGASGPEVIENLRSRRDLKHANCWYLHAIDKNSMYLSACAGLPMPIGNPVHVKDNPDILSAPAFNGAGIYHISHLVPPDAITSVHPWHLLYDGIHGPDPLYGSAEKENRQQWVSTPLLKLLYDWGYGISLDEAWIWPNSKRILEVPASQLWQLRQKLRQELLTAPEAEREAAQAAYDWVKVVATSFIGLFASSQVRDQRYKRRDIWRLVIETAKSRMLYNIDKAAEEIGMLPVAVLTDALYYVSSYPDASVALGQILNRGQDLGGFKLEYTLQIDDQVATALAAKDVSGMARQLNELAEQRESVILWR